MKTIKLSSIVIPANRQRQDFNPEALQELLSSIEDTQLMHPPVLRRGDAGEMILVAGERRIRAITDLFALGGCFTHNGRLFLADDNLIPYTDMGDLDELQAEEAELEENWKRKDLTWNEHAAAVTRLHNLRQKQKTQAIQQMEPMEIAVLPDSALTQTVAETAQEIHGRSDGYFQDSVRKELIVGQHLNNPIIAKAKNVDEAFKLLKREEEQKKNVELAGRIGASFNSSAHSLVNVNCIDWMSKAENLERFDVILTDPPYGMGAHNFGDGGGKLDGIEHHYDDSYDSWQVLMTAWSVLSYKVAKPQAHAYVFCDIDRFHELKAMMEHAGWYVFRTPFVVHKINSGRVPLPDRGPRRQYEILLYAIKGSKPVTHIYPDVIPCQADDNMSHGAQKPLALYKNLLMRSIKPGDEVLDSFAGSGTIFPACHELLCKATGLEVTPEYFAMCAKRLEGLV